MMKETISHRKKNRKRWIDTRLPHKHFNYVNICAFSVRAFNVYPIEFQRQLSKNVSSSRLLRTQCSLVVEHVLGKRKGQRMLGKLASLPSRYFERKETSNPTECLPQTQVFKAATSAKKNFLIPKANSCFSSDLNDFFRGLYFVLRSRSPRS